MSLVSKVNEFLDKTVDARFRRDSHGRLIFLPWGFGTGRLVPDAAVEARLRQGSSRMMIVLFVVIIPLIAGFNGIYQLQDWAFIAYMAACAAIGFAVQLYPAWLSRGLARSDERVSYGNAMLHSLDRFGRKFLIFGLVTSLFFTVTGTLMLVFGAGGERMAMAISLLVFVPMSFLYASALKRRVT